VKRNANRLLSLTNQILDMREAELNYDTLQKTPTDIGKLLGNLAATFLALAEKRNISFSVKMPEEQHILQIDSEKIYKIVSNLVSNSFKFTPDGGSITLDCSILPTDEGATMTLRVADTGMGISEKDLPHIFERFYYSKQLHSSHHSSGIGLNIVKQYTDLMGGTISVDKNSPQGTIFTISFPAEEVASPDATQPQTNTQHPSTVLVVDDNTDLLSYITISLQDDYNVITATNGNDALDILADEEKTIDVVVSDVMMPGINGFELTKRIKNDINLSHIPVILLTAKALEEDQLEGLQMGASDYITKPFNIDILRLRINAWMERRQATQERFSTQQEVEPEELTITTLDEQLLQKAVSVVSEHMHEPDFNVDQLASILGIHRTGLNRKLQFITGKRPILFIRSLRLKRARQLMDADPSLPISQVAYKVGFNNPKLFAKHFSEEYGCLPSEYKSKNNAE
jgi:DNA-binding response OmpR family regulator/two-component sensor histidine kinase